MREFIPLKLTVGARFVLAAKVDEPVADPLGLKQVDLRIYQKTLVEDDTSGVVVRCFGYGQASILLVVLTEPHAKELNENVSTCKSCQEVDGADREAFGTLQAKRRALLGQKDRLRLLKKMQTGKERVQRKMERGRIGKNEVSRDDEDDSTLKNKPAAREIR